MRLRGEQARTEQLGRNVDDGLTWLGSADSTLTQASSILLRVRQQLVAGQNGTNGPSERAALAGEIDELGASLVDLANTTYLGRPVFAGTQDVPAAFDTTTGAYLGNGDAVQRNVSADGAGQVGVTVPAPRCSPRCSRARAPTPGVLKRISAALRAGDTAGHGHRRSATSTRRRRRCRAPTAWSARATTGCSGIQSKGEARLDTVTANLATAESIDLPKTIIDMQIQQTAYQAALGSTAKIIQPSLVDFLR